MAIAILATLKNSIDWLIDWIELQRDKRLGCIHTDTSTSTCTITGYSYEWQLMKLPLATCPYNDAPCREAWKARREGNVLILAAISWDP